MKKIAKVLLGIAIGFFIVANNQILVIPPDSEANIEYNLQFYIDIVSKITFFVCSIYIVYKAENRKLSIPKTLFIVLLDIFLLISNAFIKEGSLVYLYGSFKNILYTILFSMAMFALLKRTLILIEDFVANHKYNKQENKLVKLIEKYPFIFSFVVIFLVFSLYMIAFYPSILSRDPSFQIKQFFNVKTKYAGYVVLLDNAVFLTNHHPVTHTMLLGGCIKLGRALLNDNFGLFIYSFIQVVFMVSTLAYTIKYLKDNKCKGKTLLILLLIYCLVPMYGFYSMSAVKDTIYTCFIIWYVIFIDKIIKTKKISIKELVLLSLIIIGVELFRNNGIYVIVLSLPFLIIYSKEIRKKILVVFLITVSFYGVFDKVILPYYKITPGSVRETLSIPFQQTARYVSLYGDELKESEKTKIDRVLKYETLATRYKPNIADPVKNKYNKHATKSDLKNYFGVWFSCFFRHPLVYIEATLNNIYGYFSPQQMNWYIYYDFEPIITEDNLVDYSYNDLEDMRVVMSSYGHSFPYFPVVGLISNIGFNTWVLLGLALYSILKKKKEHLIVLSPLLVSLLICVASPVNTYFRYAMPYVFILPSLTILFIKRFKEQ